MIAGEHLPDSGTIELGGRDVTRIADYRRARWIGRVFQDPLAGTAGAPDDPRDLDARRAAGDPPTPAHPHNKAQHRELLAVLGMGLEDRLTSRVDTLSGGQRQALTVLMATQTEPDLLMLDEHTAALDPAAAERVLDVTRQLARRGNVTTLMITHNMTHAIEVGDRTVMMHRGRVLFDLDKDERAGLTLEDLIGRFRDLAADDLSDRTALS